MSTNYECVNRIATLKQGIESTTGETYNDLTEAVQGLKDGYGGSVSDTAFARGLIQRTLSGTLDLSEVSLTSIGDYAFYKCKSLESVIIPDSVIRIYSYAFSDCSSLTSITIPDSVTLIGYSTFEYCTSLESVTIGDSVTSIGSYTFRNCTSLTSITIPGSVTTILNGAFYNCESLASVTFKGTPTSIYNDAFYNCSNLTTINVPWAEGAVANAPWGATNATINYNYTEEA